MMRRPAQELVVVLAAVLLTLLTVDVQAGTTLLVPDQFPTIQSAVDFAQPGDTVRVRPGTYVEQIRVDRDIRLKGSDAQTTVIQAPGVLIPNVFGLPVIVEVTNGANVTMSGFTVTGPGPGACRSLAAGVLVLEGATLELRNAIVSHIRDNPISFCGGGDAIAAGFPARSGPSIGHLTVKNVTVTDYQNNGIIVFGPGSTAKVSENLIVGGGAVPVHNPQNGILVVGGAVARMTGNTISDNRCSSLLPFCGPDPFTQFQAAGILLFSAGQGNVIAENHISGNDTGVYVLFSDDCCSIRENTLAQNPFFGIEIQSSSAKASENTISGSEVGIGIIADFADSVGVLKGNTITGAAMPVQELACCGFTATAVIKEE